MRCGQTALECEGKLMDADKPRLKAITIENFRCIGPASRINLKPITLLFGPNSAGKSTVFAALEYFREILSADSTDFLNEEHFISRVHKHDAEKRIRIRLEIEVTDLDPKSRRTQTSAEGSPSLDLFFDHDVLWIECTIGMLEVNVGEKPIRSVKCLSYAVGVGDKEFIRSHCCEMQPAPPYISDSGGRLTLNPRHPLINEIVSDMEDVDRPDSVPAHGWLLRYTDNIGLSPIQVITSRSEAGACMSITINAASCIPDPSRRSCADVVLESAGVDNADQQDSLASDEGDGWDALGKHFSSVIVQALFDGQRLVLEALADAIHIGPFRSPPPRGALTGAHVADWYSGRAAWELLVSTEANSDYGEKVGYTEEDNLLVQAVGDALQGMDTGFSLKARTSAVIDTTDDKLPFLDKDFSLSRGDIAVEYVTAVLRMFERAAKAREVFLRDLVQETEIHPQDGAMGIVQLVPVIVALLTATAGTYAIEQPELHLHPAVQCELGSFLARALGKSDGPVAIIETHSEHLLLRLQKLIRKGELSPESLSVTYFQRHKSGSIVTSLRISEEGEFLDEWPDGFFEEGFEEVFGE